MTATALGATPPIDRSWPNPIPAEPAPPVPNLRPEPLRTVHHFGRFQKIGPFTLPLQVCDGRVADFDFDYFEFFGADRYQVIRLGALVADQPYLVRMQSQCVWGNFGSRQCDCGWQFEEAKRLLLEAGRGLIIYAYDHVGKGIGLGNHNLVNAEAALAGEPDILVEGFLKCGFPVDGRDFRNAAEILHHYGLVKIRLLTNYQRKLATFAEHGFEVERVPFQMPVDQFNRFELSVKANKAGHLIKLADDG